MESLLKQLRVRYSGLGQDNQEQPRVPAQKSGSFKDKKAQNWFWKQFSGQTGTEEKLDQDIEFVTAVAAAAFTITRLEESSHLTRRKSGEGLEAAQVKTKSKKEDAMVAPSASRIFIKQSAGEASKRKPEISPDQKTPERITVDGKSKGKIGESIPTTGKTPTIGRIPTIGKTPWDGKENIPEHSDIDVKVAALEKAKMDKINRRYEKLKFTILSWESEKKAKAKRRIDRVESKLELKRARASREYKNEISRIETIAEGAKKQAEERKRNEESKLKVKAKKITSTRKLPVTCFCF